MNKKILVLNCLSFLCFAQQYDSRFFRADEKPNVINIFKDMPSLETLRLILRPVQMSDAQDLFEVHSDYEVVRYMPVEQEESIERTQYWIEWRQKRQHEGQPVPWVMVDKKTNKVLGFCGFYRIDYPRAAGEIMVTLNRQWWGNGYMLEAIKAVVACGFQVIGLNRIDILFYPENKRITSLCEKAGLRFIGSIPECYYYKGHYWDRVYYTLLKKDWEQLNNNL